jgi:uncharacterized protein
MTDTHDAPATSEDFATEVSSASVDGAPPLVTFEEARIIGCLIEKERTTPAEYPLTANALMRACNQTTSRHPVVSFDERTVESALTAMKARGLVRFVHSQSNRATKYRHVVDEAWQLGADQVSLLALLLLRGPQTPGELRTRSERLHPFDSPEAAERTLVSLAAHEPSLALELERGPGQKERRWVQLLTGTPTAEDLAVASTGVVRSSARQVVDEALVQRIDALEAEVAHLRALLEELVGPIEP